VESTQDLKKKIDKLPSIQRRSADRLGSSLPKLESEKKIYTKWLETYKNKPFDKIEKEIEDLEKISNMVNDKIAVTTKELKDIQEQIGKLKEKVTPAELERIKQAAKKDEESKKKMKDWSGNSGIRVRRSRRDWVGKFDGVRFSDSRTVR
jgi:chromosome segregation ATPase